MNAFCCLDTTLFPPLPKGNTVQTERTSLPEQGLAKKALFARSAPPWLYGSPFNSPAAHTTLLCGVVGYPTTLFAANTTIHQNRLAASSCVSAYYSTHPKPGIVTFSVVPTVLT